MTFCLKIITCILWDNENGIQQIYILNKRFLRFSELNCYVAENHSQLLRPSYTPKSGEHGLDRVDRNRRTVLEPDDKED